MCHPLAAPLAVAITARTPKIDGTLAPATNIQIPRKRDYFLIYVQVVTNIVKGTRRVQDSGVWLAPFSGIKKSRAFFEQRAKCLIYG